MDIHQFLQLFLGRWRSQRSNHQFSQELGQGNSGDARSEIIITEISLEAPEVVNLCQKYNCDHNFDHRRAISALQLVWEEESLSSRKPKGGTLLITIADTASVNHGIILSNAHKSDYEFAADESLSIKTAIAGGVIEERIWYGNPNLRFRVATLIKQTEGDRLVQSSRFYSEIRIGSPKP